MQNILSTTFLLFMLGFPAHAAVISISPQDISVGGTSTLSITIDTEGSSINALEITLSLPENDALILDAHEAASFVSFWTGAPVIENNSVTLSGIIPGGFQGKGTITTLLVSGRRETTTALRVQNVAVLLNDGKGTNVPTRLADLSFSVSSDAMAAVSEEDTTPPEPFTITVISEQSISDGAFVAIFAAHDKQTGVARYEVQETDAPIPDDDAWISAVSPYVLSDQTLSSRIFVRATDYAGNIRTAQYETEKGISMLEGALYLMVSLVVVLLLFAFYVRHTHRKRIGLSNV